MSYRSYSPFGTSSISNPNLLFKKRMGMKELKYPWMLWAIITTETHSCNDHQRSSSAGAILCKGNGIVGRAPSPPTYSVSWHGPATASSAHCSWYRWVHRSYGFAEWICCRSSGKLSSHNYSYTDPLYQSSEPMPYEYHCKLSSYCSYFIFKINWIKIEKIPTMFDF